MPQSGMPGNGAPETDFEVVRVRSENEEVDQFSVQSLMVPRRTTPPQNAAPSVVNRERGYMAVTGFRRVVLCGFLAVSLPACERDVPAPPPATAESAATAPPTKRVVGPLSEAESQALATMNERLMRYLIIHKQLEQGLPKMPTQGTPEQIDAHQREFEKKMRDARKNARRGEIFTPEAEPVIRRLLAAVFAGPDGKALMESVMDEQPLGIKLDVNGRYPDTVPVSTVPPGILQTLPKLTEDMEYRFVGRHLILLDTHAHVIADFIEDAIPAE